MVEIEDEKGIASEQVEVDASREIAWMRFVDSAAVRPCRRFIRARGDGCDAKVDEALGLSAKVSVDTLRAP